MACPAAAGAEAGRDGLNQSPIDGSRNVSQHHRAMVIDPSSMRRMEGFGKQADLKGVGHPGAHDAAGWILACGMRTSHWTKTGRYKHGRHGGGLLPSHVDRHFARKSDRVCRRRRKLGPRIPGATDPFSELGTADLRVGTGISRAPTHLGAQLPDPGCRFTRSQRAGAASNGSPPSTSRCRSYSSLATATCQCPSGP